MRTSPVILSALILLWVVLWCSSASARDPEAGLWSDTSGMVAVEVRPSPRLGVVFEQPGFGSERWAHSLSFGLGVLGDTEIRTGPLFESMAPAYPWIGFRIRPVDLPGLPSVEDYLLLGVGFASDSRQSLSWDAGVGLQFQLPPLAPEPADDINTYFVENVQVVMRFSLRLSIF